MRDTDDQQRDRSEKVVEPADSDARQDTREIERTALKAVTETETEHRCQNCAQWFRPDAIVPVRFPAAGFRVSFLCYGCVDAVFDIEADELDALAELDGDPAEMPVADVPSADEALSASSAETDAELVITPGLVGGIIVGAGAVAASILAGSMVDAVIEGFFSFLLLPYEMANTVVGGEFAIVLLGVAIVNAVIYIFEMG